jgi:hypothetical protein
MKLTQLSTSFAVQHIQNAFNPQNNEVIIELPDNVRHGFYLPGNPVDHLLYLRAFAREGQTLCLDFLK